MTQKLRRFVCANCKCSEMTTGGGVNYHCAECRKEKGMTDLRDTSTSTQSTAGKKPRNAFDLPSTSQVIQAIKPRQRAYKAGPGIHVVGSAQGRRDAEMRRAMRLTRI